MIDSFIDFARLTSQQEPLKEVDISALVASVCDDACEAGLPVEAEIAEGIICSCRPREIQRAVTNLIDNAVKYGKRAHINVGLGKRRVGSLFATRAREYRRNRSSKFMFRSSVERRREIEKPVALV